MLPTVLELTPLPTQILRDAADAGKIRLVSWGDTGSKAPFADREWILRNAPGVNSIVAILPTRIDAAVMDAAGPSLRSVSTMSVGYDHVDIAAAHERGVRVGHTPQVLDDAVADFTVTLMLAAMRRLLEGSRVVQAGAWATRPWNALDFIGSAIQGKTVGFIGFSGIAQTVATRLLQFKPGRIVYSVSKPHPMDLASPAFKTLANDDYVQLHRSVRGTLPVPIDNVADRLELARVSDVVMCVPTNKCPCELQRVDLPCD